MKYSNLFIKYQTNCFELLTIDYWVSIISSYHSVVRGDKTTEYVSLCDWICAGRRDHRTIICSQRFMITAYQNIRITKRYRTIIIWLVRWYIWYHLFFDGGGKFVVGGWWSCYQHSMLSKLISWSKNKK